jgi:tetratricopeptide (TPR) repeat protein
MKYSPSIKGFIERLNFFPKSKGFYYRLTEEEKEIFDLIEEEFLPVNLLRSSGINPEIFWKSLYLFYCLDLIGAKSRGEVAEEEVIDEEKIAAERKQEEEKKEAAKKSLNDAIDLSNKLQDLNFYQLLNVQRHDSPEVAKKAYFQMARKFHPDLFDRDLPENMKEMIGDLFDHITKAYHTLSDEALREDYNKKLDSPHEDEKKETGRKAESRYRQARSLVKQTRYEEAMVLLEEAVRLDRSKASYFLLLAEVGSRFPSYHKKAENHFHSVISMEPWNPEAYVGLGLLYKKVGLKVKAANQFKKALALDADNKVALKELGQDKSGAKGLKGKLSFDFRGIGKKKR